VYQGDTGSVAPPLLNLPAATLLLLATRLLSALPPSLWCAEVVPAAISDTLAAVARDALLTASMPPDWSRAALPVLARLRPDVAE
ncbi:uncharacterized protein HaLaN_22578, partial [Haematococcus lacustris]